MAYQGMVWGDFEHGAIKRLGKMEIYRNLRNCNSACREPASANDRFVNQSIVDVGPTHRESTPHEAQEGPRERKGT